MNHSELRDVLTEGMYDTHALAAVRCLTRIARKAHAVNSMIDFLGGHGLTLHLIRKAGRSRFVYSRSCPEAPPMEYPRGYSVGWAVREGADGRVVMTAATLREFREMLADPSLNRLRITEGKPQPVARKQTEFAAHAIGFPAENVERAMSRGLIPRPSRPGYADVVEIALALGEIK